MKKTLLLLAVLMLSITANAQFRKGKGYLGASLTGLDLHYNSNDKLNLGVEAKAGLMTWDNMMLLAQASFQHSGNDAVADHFTVGVSGRYYIVQNGLYLSAGVKLLHANHNYNDIMPGAEVGYAFFINKHLTIEPAAYYQMSVDDFSNKSTVGLKVGLGFYF